MEPDPLDNLSRVLNGVASEEEEAELRRWMEADPDQAKLVETLRRAWSALADAPERYDARAAWADVASRLAQPGSPDLKDRGTGPLRLVRGGVEAPSTPARGRFSPSASGVLRAAAMIALLALPALLWSPLRTVLAPSPDSAALREVTTEPGQRARVHLADGSLVVLAPESRIRYRLGGDRRSVTLDGAALFQVAHDRETPFVVHAGKAVTRVLGTQFVVRAYPGEEQTEVAVVEGRVSFRGEESPASRAVLTRGEVGRLDDDGSTTVTTHADLDPYVGWTQGRLVFKNAPIPAALEEIGRWYGVEIRLRDPALANLSLTVTLQNEPFADILELLSATMDVRYVREGKVVTLFSRSSIDSNHPHPSHRRSR